MRPRLLLCGIAAVFAAGCPSADRPAERGAPPGDHTTLTGAPSGGTAVVLFEREPDALNPLTYDSYPASQVLHLVFRTLARRDTAAVGRFVPDLATSWELTPDSGAVVIRLRDDVRWHDGVPVTAEDVAWSIGMQKDADIASPRAADLTGIGTAVARDPLTVEVELLRRGPYTMNSLLEVMPSPRHLLDTVPAARMRFSPFGRNPVGNGLYRFRDWRQGQTLTLEANPDAPEGRPALDRIVLRMVPDMSAALTELLAGQGDVMRLTPEQAERAGADRNVEVHGAARVRPAWIAWNTRRPPGDDLRVRQAFLMGIDRPRLAQAMFGELGEPALSPIPRSLTEHCPEVRPLAYDPDRARALLAEAGWQDQSGDGIRERGGQPLRLEIDYTATDVARRDVLVAMQAMLRPLGIDLGLRPFESTAWVERLRGGEFMGSFWGWGYGPAVVGPNAEAIFHSRSIPPAGPNFAAYSNPGVDALLDSVLVTFDESERQRLWCRLEQQLVDDAVYAPVYMDPELFGVNARFQNVRFRGIEWWEDIIYWHVPTDRQLPRDRR
jgi:peptide/nickel transport system substrate-binding protein